MGRTACTEPQCLYSIAIPLLPVWAVRSVQSLSACTVELYLYSPYGPYGLYRASVPVQYIYTSTPPVGRTACTEPQCQYKGALYPTFLQVMHPYKLPSRNRDRTRSIPILRRASQHKRMTNSNCCRYSLVPPDDEQQARCENVPWTESAVFFCLLLTYTYLLTHSMEQSPFWEANISRNSPHFMEPEDSLPRLQEPTNCPYHDPD